MIFMLRYYYAITLRYARRCRCERYARYVTRVDAATRCLMLKMLLLMAMLFTRCRTHMRYSVIYADSAARLCRCRLMLLIHDAAARGHGRLRHVAARRHYAMRIRAFSCQD